MSMEEPEINDYLRRALESAGGQFSEISITCQDQEDDPDITFLTDRPLTPRTAEQKQTDEGVKKTAPNLLDIESRLQQIKAQKAAKLVGDACEEMILGNFLAAQAKLNRAIEMKSDNPNFYMLRGECCLHLCDFGEATLNYSHAIETSHDLVPEWEDRLAYIHFLYSQILHDEQDDASALLHVNLALRTKPTKFSYRSRKVVYLFALKEHKQCLEVVEQLLESSENAELYVLRARLNKLFGHITKCFYDVHQALELDPSNTQAQSIVDELNTSAEDCRSAAVNQALSGNLVEAINKISVAIDTNPAVAEYVVFRGTLLRQQGQFDEAIDDFMAALTKVGETSKPYLDAMRQLVLTYNDFAVECFTKGYYEEAISLLDQVCMGKEPFSIHL